jgi:hypothetical protein
VLNLDADLRLASSDCHRKQQCTEQDSHLVCHEEIKTMNFTMLNVKPTKGKLLVEGESSAVVTGDRPSEAALNARKAILDLVRVLDGMGCPPDSAPGSRVPRSRMSQKLGAQFGAHLNQNPSHSVAVHGHGHRL